MRGRFDHHRLNELVADPQLFEELIADMRERGVGTAAQRKVLVVMSAVLTAAVEWKKIPTNPVWRMRKPPGTRQRHPHPFPPVVVERIRLRMARRETKDASGVRATADACLVSLMSYAGLRPGEALALTWGDIGSNTLAVDKAVRDGAEAPTKTGAVRTVPLVGPLQSDLDDLRWKCGLPENDRLVIPASDGGHWSRSEFNNWRNRVWKPVLPGWRPAIRAGPPGGGASVRLPGLVREPPPARRRESAGGRQVGGTLSGSHVPALRQRHRGAPGRADPAR